MYIYDRQLTGPQNRRKEQFILLPPSQRYYYPNRGRFATSETATAAFGVSAPANLVVKLERIKIETNGNPRIIPLGSTGPGRFEGFFRRPLPHSLFMTIEGRIEIEDGSTVRPYTAAARKAQRRKDRIKHVYSRTDVGRIPEITSETSVKASLGADGSFSQETIVQMDSTMPTPRSLNVSVYAFDGGEKVRASSVAHIELIDLIGFLAIINPLEKARPSKQTPLQFLASVRKVYPCCGRDEPLKTLFDQFITRHKDVASVVPPGSAEDKRLLMYETLYFEGETIDIEHVLAGIESSPNQDPRPTTKASLVSTPEIVLTWGGDLASALSNFIRDNFVTLTGEGTLDGYLGRFASRADLIGDIDGVNIGAVYDARRSIAANITAYYGKKSRRRFHEFIANTKDDAGTKALPLVSGSKPPRLSKPAHEFISRHVISICMALLWVDPKVGPNRIDDNIRDMLKETSTEIRLVTNYFVRFLEDGLTEAIGP